ncbi:MAG TPA: S9 family peptidase [Trueperaceae bacterium]
MAEAQRLPDFERYVAVRLVGSPAFSPRGDAFAYVANTTGLPALWLQPAGGGFPRQLTAFPDRRVAGFRWSPDGRRIALLADHHGDEMFQVHVLEAGGWPRQLTSAPRVQYSLGGWAPDSRRLAITGNDREPSEQDAMVIDVETGEVTRLVTGGLFYAGDFSPDGRRLLVTEILSNTHQRVHVVDLESGERRCLLGEDGEEAKRFPVGWDAAGSGVYVVTDEGHEFSYLVHLPLAGGAARGVLRLDADVADARLNHGRDTLVAAVNDRGVFKLRVYELGEGGERETAALDLPFGEYGGMSVAADGREAILDFATPREASNLFAVDLATGAMEPREQSMLGGVDPATMVEPEAITYPSFDRDVPAWLYRPRGEGPFPVVLSIHGGPESQELAGYAYLGLYQYLLSRGIGVLAPNIRGSTGYGKSYQKLIHRDWGGGELKDIEAAADYLASLDWVDAGRIAVFGGSFGGFATLSALTRLPDRWVAGVDIVGPSNLITFVQSVPPFWRAMLKDWVGDAEEDREMLIERSPITYVDQLKAPLLVIQGANDPRVVKAESDQMVERLRERGVAVEYYVDEEAGHGPPSRDGWLKWLRMTAEFLERHLLRG